MVGRRYKTDILSLVPRNRDIPNRGFDHNNCHLTRWACQPSSRDPCIEWTIGSCRLFADPITRVHYFEIVHTKTSEGTVLKMKFIEPYGSPKILPKPKCRFEFGMWSVVKREWQQIAQWKNVTVVQCPLRNSDKWNNNMSQKSLVFYSIRLLKVDFNAASLTI